MKTVKPETVTKMVAIYNHHCRYHGADFEVCDHPACKAVRRIEALYGLEVYGPVVSKPVAPWREEPH